MEESGCEWGGMVQGVHMRVWGSVTETVGVGFKVRMANRAGKTVNSGWQKEIKGKGSFLRINI